MKRSTFTLLLLLMPAALLAAQPLETLTVTIDGMDCGGCAKGIEAMLENVDGVVTVKVSFENREGVIQYDSSKITSAKIVAEIESLGYKITVKK